MRQVGVSTDGKIVVAGLGKLYFEQGTPLAVLFTKLEEEGYLPSWNHLYEEMKANGMGHKRIIHLLHEQVFEAYGAHFRDVVISRLD